MRFRFVAAAAALLTLLHSLPASAANAVVRRFALIVGTNNGGPGRATLRHAEDDARKVSQVLESLGGVAREDTVLLLDASPQLLRERAAVIRNQLAELRARGLRTELLFYYSGHSDEEGLLLRGERFDYPELHRVLTAVPTDFRIAILDSCSSGAFTRRKGGKHIPAFLVDASSAVTGQAILTSSSANEASQESDRLGGSFFTHHLLSGLRGAADHSRDGKVTLNEAYQFAFEQTLARTERTQGGAQHPSYSIEVAGTGEVVITDLRTASAGLVLGEELDGQVFVRDEEGRLIAELKKRPAARVTLGLEAGRYTVLLARGRGAFRSEVTVAKGKQVALASEGMERVELESTELRGDPSLQSSFEAEPERFAGRLALQAALGGGLGGGNVYPTLELSLDHRWEVLGLGMTASYLLGNGTRGALSFVPHLLGRWTSGKWELSGGGGVGLSMFDPQQWNAQSRTGLGVAFQAFAAAGYSLTRTLDLYARLQLTLSPEPPTGTAPFSSLSVGVQWRMFPD